MTSVGFGRGVSMVEQRMHSNSMAMAGPPWYRNSCAGLWDTLPVTRFTRVTAGFLNLKSGNLRSFRCQ